MGRPRKALPQDPFADLSQKTEVLEREMQAQRAAIERLKQISKARPVRTHDDAQDGPVRRRAGR